ncbi:Uncharacterized protein APZ42_008337 [Daphnia magna]|uniref:Uncharacterized protein n=1 Tax=Daphnia magna TaxID=35525 RepID=A0A164EPZ8_9CRUS|nr:Uncharacterized protein APZ42_008337 [Daphnia magna]
MFEKYGSKLAAEIDETRKEVICLMFDGRKDQTLTKTILSNRGGIEIREVVTQDHYGVNPRRSVRSRARVSHGFCLNLDSGFI